MKDQFKNTRRFTIAVLLAILTLCIFSVIIMKDAAASIVSIAIPSMAGMVTTYTGITNKWGKDNG